MLALLAAAAATGALELDNENNERLFSMQHMWRKDLLENVMPFWLSHSLDKEEGGYFTCLDRDGTVLDESKYHWLQGRSVWSFSRLYNELHDASDLRAGVTEEMRESWFAAAKLGADFLHKGLTDDGRILFCTTREGTPLHFQRKPYAAVFYILGNLEYSQAIRTRRAEGKPCAGCDADAHMEIAISMFEQFRKWIDDPTLCGRLPPPEGAKPTSVLGEVMCLASLSEEFIAKLPEQRERFMPFVEDAMRRVLFHFDSERHIFMESADPVRGVDHSTMAGRFFNPGHSIEVSWFLLHLCRLRPSEHHRRMALQALEGSLMLGWDSDEYNGGLLYMMDVLGKPLLDATVTADAKLWWPQGEALYATLLAYLETGDEKWLRWLEKLHAYIYMFFYDGPRDSLTFYSDDVPYDDHGGEWFGYLNRDGTVANRCKGGNYKGMFHVPRTLLFCVQAVEKALMENNYIPSLMGYEHLPDLPDHHACDAEEGEARRRRALQAPLHKPLQAPLQEPLQAPLRAPLQAPLRDSSLAPAALKPPSAEAPSEALRDSSLAPAALNNPPPAEAPSEAWVSAWRSRLSCWWAALPAPTRAQLGSCMGALGIHIAARLEALMRATRATLGGNADTTAGAADVASGQCGWLDEGGALALPDFPPLPVGGGRAFALPPIPRLLPAWQQLQSLAEGHRLARLAGREQLARAQQRPRRPREQKALGEKGVGAFALGSAIGGALGAALLFLGVKAKGRWHLRRAAPAKGPGVV